MCMWPFNKKDDKKKKLSIHEKLNIIMATQAELVADIKAATEQLKKVDGEVKTLQGSVDTLKTKVAELEAIIAQGGTIGQELVDAVAELKAQVQVVDDNVPDVVVPPPPTV